MRSLFGVVKYFLGLIFFMFMAFVLLICAYMREEKEDFEKYKEVKPNSKDKKK